MKKYFSLIIVALFVVVLSGCGASKKNLKCSMDYTTKAGLPSGIKMVMDADINFKSDKIEDMTIAVTFELNDTYKSQIDTLVSNMDSTYKSQYKGEHFKVTTDKTSDSSFTTKIYMDYKNMTDAEKQMANVSSGSKVSESYKVNKQDLEKQGFTCK